MRKSSQDPIGEIAGYLFQQGRFRHLKGRDELIQAIQERVRLEWQKLKAKTER
jgi:hypothetical protein